MRYNGVCHSRLHLVGSEDGATLVMPWLGRMLVSNGHNPFFVHVRRRLEVLYDNVGTFWRVHVVKVVNHETP